MPTINGEESAGSDWRISFSWTNLTLVLRLVIFYCSDHLEIKRTLRVITKHRVAIKSGEVSVKTWETKIDS